MISAAASSKIIRRRGYGALTGIAAGAMARAVSTWHGQSNSWRHINSLRLLLCRIITFSRCCAYIFKHARALRRWRWQCWRAAPLLRRSRGAKKRHARGCLRRTVRVCHGIFGGKTFWCCWTMIAICI